MESLGYLDVFLRLGAAVLAGAVIGFDREVRRQACGPAHDGARLPRRCRLRRSPPPARRQAIPRRASFRASSPASDFSAPAPSSADRTEESVRGLTTAASIWLAAAVGVACGLAFWPLVLLSCGFGLLILVLEPIERWLKAAAS